MPMKAIRVHAFGGPEVLKYEDVPEPTPKPGEAVVKIDAAGVNFIDIYQRTGTYKASLPLTLGQEGAGTITKVGADTAGVQVGDRVAWAGVVGSYAESNAVPVDRLVPLPQGVTTKQGAATMLQGITAHYLACSTYPLKSGDTCLVHAGAGGVGLLLTQIAKLRGARVIATVSTEEKAALSRGAGADEVVLYTSQDFEEAVRQFTGGKGVQVVYESVGQTTFAKSLNSLAPR
ncbi:MAG: NADPH:quinone reductase, partial [Acidobacteria bacterium RIFCSPLOWO2_12_FULL_65_11]